MVIFLKNLQIIKNEIILLVILSILSIVLAYVPVLGIILNLLFGLASILVLAIIGARLRVKNKTKGETAKCAVIVSLIITAINLVITIISIAFNPLISIIGIYGLILGTIVNIIIIFVGYFIGEPLAKIKLPEIIKEEKQMQEQKKSDETL